MRLGEFDLNAFMDGKYYDVDIARSVRHEHWYREYMINDIAILYLAHDVAFSGSKFQFLFTQLSQLTETISERPFCIDIN